MGMCEGYQAEEASDDVAAALLEFLLSSNSEVLTVLYGYIGTMRTRPGQRDEVVSILLRGADELRAAGCHVYIVSVVDEDDDLVHVTEVWDSREHHHASLQLPEVKAAIAEAMPMLTGEFTSREVRVAGGLGLGG